MKENFWHRLKDPPSRGGLFGALAGVIVSVFYHRKEDKALKNAGKTALLSGIGFMLGEWFEKVFTGKSHNTSPPK